LQHSRQALLFGGFRPPFLQSQPEMSGYDTREAASLLKGRQL